MAKKKTPTTPKIDRYLAEVKRSLIERPHSSRARWGEHYVRTLAAFDPATHQALQGRSEADAEQFDDAIPALMEWLTLRWKGQ